MQADYTQKGLDADTRALTLNPDYVDALVIKNILLRMQANLISSPARQKELIAEADRLRDRAMELQAKQNAAAAATTPAAGAGTGSGRGSDR